MKLNRSTVSVMEMRSIAWCCAFASGLGGILYVPKAAGQCIGSWKLIPTAHAPSARQAHSMTFDAGTGQIFLYGGWANGGQPLDETWSWNGSDWSRVAAVGPSPARAHCGLAYDHDRRVVVLFGGELPLTCDDSRRYLGDTWTWDSGHWTQAATTGPERRSQAAMAYDRSRRQVLMFGGGSNCGPGLGDTWGWDGGTWTNQHSSQPGTHNYAATWFDVNVGRVRIFGGYNGDYLNDMWEWTGSSWSEVPQANPRPRGRYAHAAAYDETSGRVLLFGGTAGVATLGDTWIFVGGAWTNVDSAGMGPSARSGSAMAYDPLRDQFVLFGGLDGVDSTGDTWIWSTRPVIVNQPASAVIRQGQAAAFSIGAVGLGGTAFQWRKNGQNLVTGGRIFNATSSTLFIYPVDTSDVGTYDVLVTDECGTEISQSAPLVIAADCCRADVNHDGAIDGQDVQPFIASVVSGECP